MMIQIRGKPLSSKNNGEILGATVLEPGDFPLGSSESRMAARIRLQRVGVAAERPSACICFPENESPFFAFEIELEMLTRVTCPLHGQRFKPYYRIFVAKWLRAKQPHHLWTHHSEQYRKAWFASFPPDLWPAGGRIFLKLKDGTRLLASEPTWTRKS